MSASAEEKRRLKAVALSGLVLPGAGQLHVGARVRGTLLVAASVLLLALFVLRCLEATVDAVSSAPATLDLARTWESAWEAFGRHRGRLAPVVLGLFLVWVLGIADAWYGSGVAKAEASEDTEGRPRPGRRAP